MDDKQWISAQEAGRRCGVSPAAIHAWRLAKAFSRLLARKSPTGRVFYKFPADEVDRMAKDLKPVVVRA